MNQPLVSIVLPAFNRAGYLRSAIESVLAQSLTSWEMIVADDGSGPEAAEFLRGLGDPRIRVLWLAHSGNPSVARNAALRDARGTYVAFLDSDDLWAPNKLEAQTAAQRARGQCHWSFTNVEWIDAAGGLMPPRETFVPHEGRIVEALLTIDAYIALPTVLVERRLLDEAGLFDEELRFGEDYDLWLRLATRSDVVAVTDKLTRVRLHADNHSHDRRSFYRDWLRLYEKAGTRTSDPRLLDICRRKRAALAVGLASIEAADGRTAAVCLPKACERAPGRVALRGLVALRRQDAGLFQLASVGEGALVAQASGVGRSRSGRGATDRKLRVPLSVACETPRGRGDLRRRGLRLLSLEAIPSHGRESHRARGQSHQLRRPGARCQPRGRGYRTIQLRGMEP